MKARNLAAIAAALLGAACSSNDSDRPDGGTSGTGGGDAGPGPDGGTHPLGPKHTLKARDLLGTPVDNLLLDPFVSTDSSYGHFVGVVFTVQGGTYYASYFPDREFRSLSPAGVTLPVLDVVPAPSIQDGLYKIQVISPFAGGSVPFDASIWVSAREGDKGVALGKTDGLVVTLLPNDRPASAYPLVPTGKPVELDGRTWVKLALKSPASLPEGGWFSIVSQSSKWTFDVQAPAVTPASTAGSISPADAVPRGPHDAAALAAYVEITRRKH